MSPCLPERSAVGLCPALGGDERVRADDHLLAKQVLSQLSSSPVFQKLAHPSPTKKKSCLLYTSGIGGLNNFSETYLDFGHTTVENYERGLLLNEALAYVKYDCAGVH